MSTPQLKLSYFNFAGRAELSRLLFTFANVAFTDDRVTNFREFKPTCPLGQVPVLEVDGVLFSQSMAIARYAARIGGLYPEDPVEALRADMISETLLEVHAGYYIILRDEKDDAAKAEKLKQYVEESVPKVFAVLESMVQGKYFMGDNATYVDVQLLDMVLNALNKLSPALNWAPFPKMESIVASVKANARIAAHLAKHQ